MSERHRSLSDRVRRRIAISDSKDETIQPVIDKQMEETRREKGPTSSRWNGELTETPSIKSIFIGNGSALRISRRASCLFIGNESDLR